MPSDLFVFCSRPASVPLAAGKRGESSRKQARQRSTDAEARKAKPTLTSSKPYSCYIIRLPTFPALLPRTQVERKRLNRGQFLDPDRPERRRRRHFNGHFPRLSTASTPKNDQVGRSRRALQQTIDHRSCLLHPSSLLRTSSSDLLSSHACQASRPLRVSPVFVLLVLSSPALTWVRRLLRRPFRVPDSIDHSSTPLRTLEPQFSWLFGLIAPPPDPRNAGRPEPVCTVPTSL